MQRTVTLAPIATEEGIRCCRFELASEQVGECKARRVNTREATLNN